MIAQSAVEFENYRGKTVFVTGATGLVGSLLVKAFLCVNRLKDCDIRVIAAVRNRKKAENIYGKLLERKDLKLYIGDVAEPMDYEGTVDYIFHTASVPA